MRKILISSTALSVALGSFHTLPVVAQSLGPDGSVIGPDGTVLCVPAEGTPCDLGAIIAQMAGETDAATQAAPEDAPAEASDAAKGAATGTTPAPAPVQPEPTPEAEAPEATVPDDVGPGEAASDNAAPEAAAADPGADMPAAEGGGDIATPEVETPPAPEPERADGQEEALDPAPRGQTPEDPAETPPESATGEGDAGVAEGGVTTETPAGTTAPAGPESAPEALAPEALAPEALAPEAAAEMVPEVAPVDAPVPDAGAVEALAGLLSDPAAGEGIAGAAAAAVAAALAGDGDPGATPAPESGPEPVPETAPDAGPVAVVTGEVTEDSARTSAQDFAAAPETLGEGKKSGLSDLEKVGLVALGALVVGAVINEGKADEKKVVSNSGDRVVVENPGGGYTVYKDDDAVLRQPGVRTTTETYRDGSTLTEVERADGTRVVTVRDASGRVLRRSAYDAAGMETLLIDDLAPEVPVEVAELPPPRPDRVTISTADSDAALRAELAAIEAEELGRKFSLRQIREIREVRALAATVEVDSITFDTGSAAIRTTEARKLADLGRLMQDLLSRNPAHVFLIEGHTDAVGAAPSNLLLSDRRAESLALALTEYFGIPPENLVVQGYGESELKVVTEADERANRRVVVRLVTPLLQTAALR